MNELRTLYRDGPPFFLGTCLKIKADQMVGPSSQTLSSEALSLINQAMQASQKAVTEIDEQQRQKEKTAKRLDFWAGVLDNTGQALLGTYSAQQNQKQFAQLGALKNSSTPSEYYQNYHALMAKSPMPVTSTASRMVTPVHPGTQGLPEREFYSRGWLRERIEQCRLLSEELQAKLVTGR